MFLNLALNCLSFFFSRFSFSLSCLYRVNADLAVKTALALKLNHAVNLGVDGEVLAQAYVLAHLEAGAFLAHDDAAGGYDIAVVNLGAPAFALLSRPL